MVNKLKDELLEEKRKRHELEGLISKLKEDKLS